VNLKLKNRVVEYTSSVKKGIFSRHTENMTNQAPSVIARKANPVENADRRRRWSDPFEVTIEYLNKSNRVPPEYREVRKILSRTAACEDR
jgi:hypothetical protein